MSTQLLPPMTAGSTIPIQTNVRYFVHPKHRGTPTKNSCTWTIPVPEEVGLFKKAIFPGFCPGVTYWAADYQGGRLRMVGINFSGESLAFGKFVDGGAIGEWHGYPADYRRRPLIQLTIEGAPKIARLCQCSKLGSLKGFWRNTMSRRYREEKMHPLKLTIPGDFWDVQIYKGRLYLWHYVTVQFPWQVGAGGRNGCGLILTNGGVG